MKKVLIGIFSCALMLAVATAQNQVNVTPAPASKPETPAPPQTPVTPSAALQAGPVSSPASPVTRIAPGSVLPVSLSKTIDAKKAKAGDEVTARVTQDMKSNSGEIIVAKDTKVMGHVTEAQARDKEQKESQLGIVFDRAVMKNGSEMAMPMSIQAIVGPQNNRAENNQSGAAIGNGGAAQSTNGVSPNNGGRNGMAGSTASPPPSTSTDGDMPSEAQASQKSRAPITAQTEGVIGISNLKLTTAASNSSQGSLVTSEKNNVKIESGTLMLLRVNQ